MSSWIFYELNQPGVWKKRSGELIVCGVLARILLFEALGKTKLFGEVLLLI